MFVSVSHEKEMAYKRAISSVATLISILAERQVEFNDGLERGLTGLSSVLESLGDKQVVVQQVTPERRGWFGGKKRNGRR